MDQRLARQIVIGDCESDGADEHQKDAKGQSKRDQLVDLALACGDGDPAFLRWFFQGRFPSIEGITGQKAPAIASDPSPASGASAISKPDLATKGHRIVEKPRYSGQSEKVLPGPLALRSAMANIRPAHG